MKFTKQNFIPLIFAGDINSYSMARAFYQAYQVKSITYGKYYTGPNCNSKIVDYRNNKDIEKEDIFLETVTNIANENPNKKIITIYSEVRRDYYNAKTISLHIVTSICIINFSFVLIFKTQVKQLEKGDN